MLSDQNQYLEVGIIALLRLAVSLIGQRLRMRRIWTRQTFNEVLKIHSMLDFPELQFAINSENRTVNLDANMQTFEIL